MKRAPRGDACRDLLRLVTCGSVDDGKSTLIGRLLYDSRLLSDDQLRELGNASGDSAIVGAGDAALDFSLALDGLAAEREQSITIDVAHRAFATRRRSFLLADVPGHEQYTRNMITGASTADLAVLVVDVRKGIQTQTRRHAYLAWLLGIRHFVLAANKMDLVDFAESAFDNVTAGFREFLKGLDAVECRALPVSARYGDNVTVPSLRMHWYGGPTLMAHLEEVEPAAAREAAPFRFPVQWINRPTADFRGYGGLIAAGEIGVGEWIRVHPSEAKARVERIVTFDGDRDRAAAGEAVTLLLDAPIDVARGHLISGTDRLPELADTLDAVVIWMSDQPLLPWWSYRLKLGAKSVVAQVADVKHRIDIDTLSMVHAKAVALNEIAVCTLTLDEPVAFDLYDCNRDTGGFILIDRATNETVGAGLIRSGELRNRDVPWQKIEISKASHTALKKHPPGVLWFTGISGAGKSTIANLVEKMLHVRGWHTYILDGDNLRHGLNADLGFSDSDRIENMRRVAEVAKLMADAGLLVLVALISPFLAERRRARELMPPGEFVEIFVDTPLAVAEARDTKGLYGKARRGTLKAFTGIDSAYEVPGHPEVHIETTKVTAEQAAEVIVSYLNQHLSSPAASR